MDANGYPKIDFFYDGRDFTICGYDHDDDIFTRIKQTQTFYEVGLLEFIKRQRLNGVYVDIGANIGNHTLFFMNICNCSSVIAIEPHREIFEILKKNCYTNNYFQKNIQFINEVISVHPEIYYNYYDKSNVGMSFVSLSEKRENSVLMSTKTLDDLLNTIEGISLIKIDVEGHELDVLKSGKQVLGKFKPAILVESFDSNFPMIKDFLNSQNYGYIAKLPGYNHYFLPMSRLRRFYCRYVKNSIPLKSHYFFASLYQSYRKIISDE